MKTKAGGLGLRRSPNCLFRVTGETLNRGLRDMTALCEIFDFDHVNGAIHIDGISLT